MARREGLRGQCTIKEDDEWSALHERQNDAKKDVVDPRGFVRSRGKVAGDYSDADV